MKNNIREILDETNISIVDELNILEYIDELEQIKEESLDKLDELENKIYKAIALIKRQRNVNGKLDKYNVDDLLDILRGKDNE